MQPTSVQKQLNDVVSPIHHTHIVTWMHQGRLTQLRFPYIIFLDIFFLHIGLMFVLQRDHKNNSWEEFAHTQLTLDYMAKIAC